jgi:hypothetical protein
MMAARRGSDRTGPERWAMELSIPLTWPDRFALLACGLVLLGLALLLTRSRRLREPYTLVWIGSAIGLMVLFVMPDALLSLAEWLGIQQMLLVVILAVAVLAGLAVHFSVVIARQEDHERSLSQEMALLRDDMKRMRTDVRESPPLPPEPKPRPPSLRT